MNRQSSVKHPALSGPVTIGEWWKTRNGQSIRVALRPYAGHALFDLRSWWTGDDGILHPGKGFSCRVAHLPKLAATIEAALAKAHELGLLPSDEAGDG